jgi:hypothetical protein
MNVNIGNQKADDVDRHNKQNTKVRHLKEDLKSD